MKEYSFDFASLTLRFALGIMFIAHGLMKLLIFTPAGTASYFESLGFLPIMGYLTILFEIGGGIILLLGLFAEIIALLTIVQMIVISYIHFPSGWLFSNTGGGWEYSAFMALTALALLFLGDGRFSVMRLIKKQLA